MVGSMSEMGKEAQPTFEFLLLRFAPCVLPCSSPHREGQGKAQSAKGKALSPHTTYHLPHTACPSVRRYQKDHHRTGRLLELHDDLVSAVMHRAVGLGAERK